MVWSPQSRKPPICMLLAAFQGTASQLYAIYSIWEALPHLHVIGSSSEPQPRHWTLGSCMFLPKTCLRAAYSKPHT